VSDAAALLPTTHDLDHRSSLSRRSSSSSLSTCSSLAFLSTPAPPAAADSSAVASEVTGQLAVGSQLAVAAQTAPVTAVTIPASLAAAPEQQASTAPGRNAEIASCFVPQGPQQLLQQQTPCAHLSLTIPPAAACASITVSPSPLAEQLAAAGELLVQHGDEGDKATRSSQSPDPRAASCCSASRSVLHAASAQEDSSSAGPHMPAAALAAAGSLQLTQPCHLDLAAVQVSSAAALAPATGSWLVENLTALSGEKLSTT
jgi:hypothetical protein